MEIFVVNNSIIKYMEFYPIRFVPLEGGGGGLYGPIDLEEGSGQRGKAVDPVEVGVEGKVELPVAPEMGHGLAVHFGGVLYCPDHAFRAIARREVQPLRKMCGSGQEGSDIEGKPVALTVVVFEDALWKIAA